MKTLNKSAVIFTISILVLPAASAIGTNIIMDKFYPIEPVSVENVDTTNSQSDSVLAMPNLRRGISNLGTQCLDMVLPN